MEFKEFTNPEEKYYDIKVILNSSNYAVSANPHSKQLCDLIGILEDVTGDELQEQYGISMNKY